MSEMKILVFLPSEHEMFKRAVKKSNKDVVWIKTGFVKHKGRKVKLHTWIWKKSNLEEYVEFQSIQQCLSKSSVTEGFLGWINDKISWREAIEGLIDKLNEIHEDKEFILAERMGHPNFVWMIRGSP